MNDNQKLKILISIILLCTAGLIIYLAITYVKCQNSNKAVLVSDNTEKN